MRGGVTAIQSNVNEFMINSAMVFITPSTKTLHSEPLFQSMDIKK